MDYRSLKPSVKYEKRPLIIETYRDWRRELFKGLGYEPTEEQRAFHESQARVRLVAGGERGGKSYSSAMDAFARMTVVPGGKYWIVGPDYEQPRKEFEYILEATRKAGLRVKRLSTPQGKSSPWQMKVEGGGFGYTVQTKTSTDVKRLASEALDGIIMAEAAQQDLMAYYKCRGRVAEGRGWLIMSGTFESSLGWYADYFQRWQGPNPEGGESFSLPTWSNRHIYPGGREDAEIKALERGMPADLFMERYGAIPCKPSTLVFKEFEIGEHVKEWCRYSADLPVSLAVDPGYDPGAYAVLAVQTHGEKDGPEEVWVIDEVYVRERTGPEVIEICREREWWEGAEGGVMDVAGRQHHAMKSQVEVWRSEGGIYLRSKPVPILDGIARHRTFLRDPGTGKPRLYHAPGCVNMIAEYGKYKRPSDNEKQAVHEVPIDRDNHAMKAIAYWLYDRYGPVRLRRPRPKAGPRLEGQRPLVRTRGEKRRAKKAKARREAVRLGRRFPTL